MALCQYMQGLWDIKVQKCIHWCKESVPVEEVVSKYEVSPFNNKEVMANYGLTDRLAVQKQYSFKGITVQNLQSPLLLTLLLLQKCCLLWKAFCFTLNLSICSTFGRYIDQMANSLEPEQRPSYWFKAVCKGLSNVNTRRRANKEVTTNYWLTDWQTVK